MSFKAFDSSLDLIRELRPLVARIRRQDADLFRHMKRAATSVSLNLAEGSARKGEDARHFFRIARGSAKEVQAALAVAEAWGCVGGSELAGALARVDRVLALTWGLC